MFERGVEVDHSTFTAGVQKFTPQLEATLEINAKQNRIIS